MNRCGYAEWNRQGMKIELLMTLQAVHILAAVGLIGASVYNFFILRPALRAIPPPQAVVISQKTGLSLAILIWIALGLLVSSGVYRLYLMELLGDVFTVDFYSRQYGRWLVVMMGGFLATLVIAAVITFQLRPALIRKLSVDSQPGPADMVRRQQLQMAYSQRLDYLSLASIIAAVIAALAGSSLRMGGWF